MPGSPAEPARLGLAVPLTQAGLDRAQDELAAWLEAAQMPAPACYRIRLIVEELVANLMMHGRFAGPPAPLRLSAEAEAASVLLTLEDAAEPFDPRAAPAPQRPTLAGERLGGLGLPLVRRMAEIRDYRRLPDGWNRLELAVARDGAASGSSG